MVRTFNRFNFVCDRTGYISQRDFQFLVNMMQSVENIDQFLY